MVKPGGMVGFFDGDYASLTFSHADPATGKTNDEALINAVIRAPSIGAALGDAADIVRALSRGVEPFRVLGPAPAPLSRLKGEHRAQFFMKGSQRGTMRKALLAALEARPEIKRRTTIDVDPMSVL